MMQSRRREHCGSSRELDVFGATSYFAVLPPAPDDDDCASIVTAAPSSADRGLYFQAKVVQRDTDTTRVTTEDNSFRSPHHQQRQLAGVRDHAERHATNKLLQLQVVAAKRQPSGVSGKSKLAALLSFMVSPSPSPRASFRKENKQEAPLSTTRLLLRQAEAATSAPAAGGGEREPADNTYCKAAAAAAASSSSSRESSMQLQGLFGALDDDDGELDLGVATGDRRLQGITVVRGSGGDEERWVVRCVPGPGGACWDWDWDDDERREKMLDAAESASSGQNIKDEMVEVEEQLQGDGGGGGGGNNIDPAAHSWDSDSSSDLFDLDLEYR